MIINISLEFFWEKQQKSRRAARGWWRVYFSKDERHHSMFVCLGNNPHRQGKSYDPGERERRQLEELCSWIGNRVQCPSGVVGLFSSVDTKLLFQYLLFFSFLFLFLATLDLSNQDNVGENATFLSIPWILNGVLIAVNCLIPWS